jgi:hypothetical protein
MGKVPQLVIPRSLRHSRRFIYVMNCVMSPLVRYQIGLMIEADTVRLATPQSPGKAAINPSANVKFGWQLRLM